jgi:hypothetical protein
MVADGMMPGDPLFDRIMWSIIRFVFLPALLVMGLAIVVFFFLAMAQVV